MSRGGKIAAVIAACGFVVILAGCAAPAHTATTSSTQTAEAAAPSESPTPTPTPTPPVTWQDPEKLIMLPDATTPQTLPHGPSWSTQDGTMKCGIYDDTKRYSSTGDDLGTEVFYGCRIKYGANRFTYPPTPHEGQVGGCPSGFAAAAGQAVTALCNSGQVFASETGSPTVLMPGDGVRFAGIECVALSAGMSCTETATGHGFRVTLDDFTVN